MKKRDPTYLGAPFDRLLNVFFYTSNVDKLLQARLIFGRHGYPLFHYRSHTEPYDEDYSLETHELLHHAIKEIRSAYSLKSVFFVEDTSLRIECLSDGKDYPGVRVKEWFGEVTFAELDKQIAARGGDRTAIVKSDIALHIPTLPRPIFFHGETSGTVAESEPSFQGSVQYPWLTPHTFNGWFIPDGSNKRLGEMTFEESLQFDFRTIALNALIERLFEISAGADLPRSHFLSIRSDQTSNKQLSFIAPDLSVLLVIGNKCAGKTTFGDFAIEAGWATVFEASSVLRSIAEAQGENINSGKEAMAFLDEYGQDIVARKIVELIGPSQERTVIITGLRTIEELGYISEKFPGLCILQIISDDRLRYERHIARARDEDAITYRQFKDLDEEQMEFGLLRVANEICDYSIINDGTITQYKEKFSEFWRKDIANFSIEKIISRRLEKQKSSELLRSLSSLNKLKQASTCQEISNQTKKTGSPVRIYNTNRALKTVPELAKRIEKKGALLRYRVLPRGKRFLRIVGSLARPS